MSKVPQTYEEAIKLGGHPETYDEAIQRGGKDPKAASHGASGTWAYPTKTEQFQADHPNLTAPLQELAKFGYDVVGHIPHSVEDLPNAGKGGVLRGIPEGIYHALSAPPTEDEKKLPPTIFALKRLIYDPAKSAITNANDMRDMAVENEKMTGKYDWASRVNAASHVLGAVPVVGSVAERAGAGDLTGAAAEATVLGLAPEVASEVKGMIPAEGIRAIPGAIRSKQMSMLIKPNKAAFDFGADPVREASTIPVSKTRAEFGKNIQHAIDETTNQLHEEIARRTEIAHQAGADTGIDVRPYIESKFNQAIAKAQKDGNPSLIKQLERFKKARIDDLIGQYGSTYLDPEQIIAEKQTLAKDTAFKTDSKSQNLNAARQQTYQAYDGALNRMFGSDPVTGTESLVKAMNQRIAGLIETEKLNEVQKIAEMNSGGDTLYSDVKRQFPTTMMRTGTNRIAGGGKGTPAFKSGAYEFFPKMKPGPYESGYQAQGGVAPDMASAPPMVEGGVHRPSETATGIHPTTLDNIVEGGVHRPSEIATGIHPTTLGDTVEGGVHRPAETATGVIPTPSPAQPYIAAPMSAHVDPAIGQPLPQSVPSFNGVQQHVVSPAALPPNDFHIGESGIKYKLDPKTGKVLRDPVTNKPVIDRDFTAQKQLFSVDQTPYRWQPAMRETSSMQDLRAMRSEIEQYIRQQRPTGAKLKAWTKDMEDIDREIYRRVEASKTPGKRKAATP